MVKNEYCRFLEFYGSCGEIYDVLWLRLVVICMGKSGALVFSCLPVQSALTGETTVWGMPSRGDLWTADD